MTDNNPAQTMAIPASEHPMRSMDEIREGLRNVYCQGISDVLDRCLEDLILPGDQEAMLQDAAGFVVLLITSKIHAIQRGGPELGALMRAFRPLEKHICKSVPSALVDISRSQKAGE